MTVLLMKVSCWPPGRSRDTEKPGPWGHLWGAEPARTPVGDARTVGGPPRPAVKAAPPRPPRTRPPLLLPPPEPGLRQPARAEHLPRTQQHAR